MEEKVKSPKELKSKVIDSEKQEEKIDNGQFLSMTRRSIRKTPKQIKARAKNKAAKKSRKINRK